MGRGHQDPWLGGRDIGAARMNRAFEEVLGAYLDPLFSTAMRLCQGREADAEDLLQDTALKAFQAFDQLRDPAAAKAWLFTILTRTHLNHVRTQRRRAELLEGDLTDVAFEQALADWVPLPTPEAEFAQTQLRERVVEAIDALDPTLREVVWLVDVEGFHQREVARMLEVPEGTVASRLFRARRALRQPLDAVRVTPQRRLS